MSGRPSIGAYPHVVEMTTRWTDNDIYGHVNNAVFYHYFDAVANAFMIEEGGLDIHDGQEIGLVVASGCEYHAPVAYPSVLRIGLRTDQLGTSSVTHGLAVFTEDADLAVAHGHFIHVFVDRESGRPTPIPDRIRGSLERIIADDDER